MSPAQVLEADLTWSGERFEPGIQLEVDGQGRIARCGALGLQPTHRLRRRALLPGLVNAHSHAFQRGLRGSGESFPRGSGSFWSWRRAMYDLVEEIDGERFRRICRQAFEEMRSAGITAVGEFHYLHHGRQGPAYELDQILLEAAAEAGIRLALLGAYYRTGAPGREVEGAQRRFRTASPREYWTQMERLASRLEPATQSLGAVAHSVRAAEPDEIAALYREARDRGMVFHMHVEEQPREIEEVRAAWGSGPLELLLERLESAEGFTAVHCTQSEPSVLAAWIDRGGLVCICPLTEANLGDGLAPLAELLEARPAAADSLSLGTDSNARISMAEEMRWLEYGQRLAGGRRGVLRDARGEVAQVLLQIATRGGARALGLPVGGIESGRPADLAALDLDHPSLNGAGPEALPAAFVFGSCDEAVSATAVAGAWRQHR